MAIRSIIHFDRLLTDQEVDAIEDGDELEHEAFEQRQAITRFAEFIEEFKSQSIG